MSRTRPVGLRTPEQRKEAAAYHRLMTQRGATNARVWIPRGFAILLAISAGPAQAQLTAFSEKVVAGTPSDLMIVRHLVIRGDNASIGKKLAEIAKVEHNSSLGKVDPDVGPLQMRWLSAFYPERIQRADGVRAAFGLSAETDLDPTHVPIDQDLAPACSVIYYPPDAVTNGHAMLSRNYDFPKATFGELTHQRPPPGARSMTGDPYVIEMYPDQGYPSLFTCAYDLVAGAVDGVNSKGVTVALLADENGGVKRRGTPGYGLSEVDLPRFVLDRCASAKEAREKLKDAPYFATFTPCHYIIGDATGDSFIFEVGPDNKHYIIEGGGKPQIVTNHSIAMYGTSNLPSGNSFDRYRRLQRELARRNGKCTPVEVKEINYCVAVPSYVRVSGTLWHAVYDLTTRSVQISFCLSKADEERERRSPYLEFALSTSDQGHGS